MRFIKTPLGKYVNVELVIYFDIGSNRVFANFEKGAIQISSTFKTELEAQIWLDEFCLSQTNPNI